MAFREQRKRKDETTSGTLRLNRLYAVTKKNNGIKLEKRKTCRKKKKERKGRRNKIKP
jgi:hypothetical protein